MSPRPVRPEDRVADVLARDESLVDVFTSVAPAFERLRNPAMRKVMARLVTVEQAARVARVDLATLLERLNAAVAARLPQGEDAGAPTGGEIPRSGDAATADTAAGSASALASDTPAGASDATPAGDVPSALAAIPPERVVELDVREELRAGKEPFSMIMAARREIPEGGALRLRAIFEPVPLYAVMAKQGLEHWTEQRGPEDWVVWFHAAPADPTPGAVPPAGAGEGREEAGEADAVGAPPEAVGDGDDVVVLDVRGLEPPEPMVRTLAALETLPADATLVQLNVREPKFLLPQLAERGFSYEVRKQSEELVRVFIRHTEGA